MHQWQKFGENQSVDTGVETWKSGMHLVMPWPWTLTFWPQNLTSSSLSRDAPVTKVWRKSVNRYWRYCGNIKLPRESQTDARTHARTAARTDDPKTYSLTYRLKQILPTAFTERQCHTESTEITGWGSHHIKQIILLIQHCKLYVHVMQFVVHYYA